MFVGSINQELRTILAEIAHGWKGRPVFVGCSGNFTVERILWAAGVREIHGNDVSLYSCAIGSHLAGKPLRVSVRNELFDWLSPYLEPGLPTIATLMLCTELFKFTDRDHPYYRRMADAYRRRFVTLHAETVKRAKDAIGDLRLASFHAGDIAQFARNAPQECVFVSFPPTYQGGYERLYRKFDEVFQWDAPEYEVFDERRFAEFVDVIRAKQTWLTLRDHEVAELSEHCVGLVRTGHRSRPVFVYGNQGRTRLSLPRLKVESIPLSRLEGEIDSDLRIARIDAAQMNLLRSEYLSPAIIPSAAQTNLAVVSDAKLIGALGFTRPNYFSDWCDAYMLSDFAIRPAAYRRLSKLVLALALSHEVRAIVEQDFGRRIRTIGTTAFTDKPVSMKYRGLFDLHNRSEGKLNYVAEAGRWSVKEGLAWWMRNHATK